MLEAFLQAAPELTFSIETPADGWLQFFGIWFQVENGLCWEFGKTDSKPLLSRVSCHWKIVKQGIVKSVLTNSLKFSCVHRLGTGLEKQLLRLISAGYS